MVAGFSIKLLALHVCSYARADMLQEVITDDDECVPSDNSTGCAVNALQIQSKMAVAMQNDGIFLSALSVEETHTDSKGQGASHIFCIGDWGTLLPGHYPAPNVRPKGSHHVCPKTCDYVQGVDNNAQVLVAEQMKKRAAAVDPQYLLNVGDNFYWGGITQHCGGGLTQASSHTIQQFDYVWTSVYEGLTNKPWISTLGNHDYGGYQFNMGWDQQIAYSKHNTNWVMPARYFKQTMQHPGFSVDVFTLDTNAHDAKDPHHDQIHNICSQDHNPHGATCGTVGGPTSVADCRSWFWDSYKKQKSWLYDGVKSSKADWQIVVTHFPCYTDTHYFGALAGVGLDFQVTGHRHDQELYSHADPPCIVTGGGGGITSEHAPHGDFTAAYGFFDLTISKTQMDIELVNIYGHTVKQATIHPH